MPSTPVQEFAAFFTFSLGFQENRTFVRLQVDFGENTTDAQKTGLPSPNSEIRPPSMFCQHYALRYSVLSITTIFLRNGIPLFGNGQNGCKSLAGPSCSIRASRSAIFRYETTFDLPQWAIVYFTLDFLGSSFA